METNNKYAMLRDPEMKEIVDSFLVETAEMLEKLDADLIALESNSEDVDLLNQIFRAFHTIKGTSGFLGLERLTSVTHKCEDILNKLRKGEIKLQPELMDVVLEAFDKIKELVDMIEQEQNENVEVEGTIERLVSTLDAVMSGKTKAKAAPKKTTAKKAAPQKSQSKKPAAKSASKPKANSDKEEKKENEEINSTEEVILEEEKVEEVVAEVEEVIEEPLKQDTLAQNGNERSEQRYLNQGKTKKEDANIRVEVERLDELLNIVSELVLGRNQLMQVNSKLALDQEGSELARDLGGATKQIDLMTNELQLVVMKTRMVKIGKVFNRFPRLVRDLSKELDKDVNLVIKGEETELDKTLIEEINDPLVHLVRNSIDHGIEAEEDRVKNGKSKGGTLTLAAQHEGNNVIITVEDDGKGIDPEVIKRKAIEKGLINEQKAEELPLQDVYNLIFLPGFSTAKTVTNVSGRGVGMDVVKTNVTKLRGIINVESAPGEGTKMVIKLPLTLAIISGMVVQLNQEQVIIPLSSVVEVLRVHTEDISSINGKEVIKVRERVIPLIDIDNHLFNKDTSTDEKVFQFIVVVGIAEKQYGIKVDRMVGQQEVVIKSLGNYLKKVDGIAGSTIMGDGRVIMILDIAELIQNMKEYA
jgi:two-component system chemotaxis sensor kinase CheA